MHVNNCCLISINIESINAFSLNAKHTRPV